MKLIYLYSIRKVPRRTADIMLRSAVWSKAHRGRKIILQSDMDPKSDLMHVYEGIPNARQ